jgi:hypothetical protein
MTCESLTDIILDMARGTAVPEAARLRVRRHMDTCPSCVAEYARQRELTKGLQALAADAQEWTAPAGMEERLLAAFAAQNGKTAASDAPAPATAGRWRYVLATAAMVTLAVWGIREAGGRGNRGRGEPAGKAAAVDASKRGGTLPSPDPAEVSQRIEDPSRIAKPPTANPRTETAPVVSEPGRQANRTSKPVVSGRSRQASRSTSPPSAVPVEFVSIPGAIGLPDLESGTVLRMELPLAVLPEYGLQIVPDAMRTSIEADVLVGQDGQPRAIRLVGVPDVAQDSRSRQ